MKSIELTQIDLNLLVAFESLFEERSVTVAAQRLYLGQPAMSAALGRLRILFGDELLIRVGREMQPTAKAIAIAPGIFAALHQIRQTIRSSQNFEPASDSRDFAIGSPDYASFVIIPKLLAHCQEVASNLNFRMIEFEKDSIGDLLEQGTVDLALGVFQNPPRQTICVPLFQEHFVGIARKNHPALTQKTISLEVFANLSHALNTIRRDAIGEVDYVLTAHDLQRRIALTVPHMLVLPSIVASTDLIAAIPSRMACYFSKLNDIEIFELPIEIPNWTVSMLWSKLNDKDDASCWLRQTLQTLCEQI
jgi:DNA-binding transcriptional LysR family regulator